MANTPWLPLGGKHHAPTGLRLAGHAVAHHGAARSARRSPERSRRPPPRCGDGEDTAVLVDASSEPDLYAAYLLAGVLETGCIVDAGDHNGPLPTRRQHCSEVRPTATPSAARPRYRQRSCSPGPNGDAPGEPTGGPRSTSSDAQRATPLRCPAPKPRPPPRRPANKRDTQRCPSAGGIRAGWALTAR